MKHNEQEIRRILIEVDISLDANENCFNENAQLNAIFANLMRKMRSYGNQYTILLREPFSKIHRTLEHQIRRQQMYVQEMEARMVELEALDKRKTAEIQRLQMVHHKCNKELNYMKRMHDLIGDKYGKLKKLAMPILKENTDLKKKNAMILQDMKYLLSQKDFDFKKVQELNKKYKGMFKESENRKDADEK